LQGNRRSVAIVVLSLTFGTLALVARRGDADATADESAEEDVVGLVGAHKDWRPPLDELGFSVLAYKARIPVGCTLHVMEEVVLNGDRQPFASRTWASFGEKARDEELTLGSYDPSALVPHEKMLSKLKLVAGNRSWWRDFPDVVSSSRTGPLVPGELKIDREYVLGTLRIHYNAESEVHGVDGLIKPATKGDKFVLRLHVVLRRQSPAEIEILSGFTSFTEYVYDTRLRGSKDPVGTSRRKHARPREDEREF
jgi:hypothetical protein